MRCALDSAIGIELAPGCAQSHYYTATERLRQHQTEMSKKLQPRDDLRLGLPSRKGRTRSLIASEGVCQCCHKKFQRCTGRLKTQCSKPLPCLLPFLLRDTWHTPAFHWE